MSQRSNKHHAEIEAIQKDVASLAKRIKKIESTRKELMDVRLITGMIRNEVLALSNSTKIISDDVQKFRKQVEELPTKKEFNLFKNNVKDLRDQTFNLENKFIDLEHKVRELHSTLQKEIIHRFENVNDSRTEISPSIESKPIIKDTINSQNHPILQKLQSAVGGRFIGGRQRGLGSRPKSGVR